MTYPRQITLEVAVFSPQAALDAAHAGANRIELCSGFYEGGLSPMAGTIRSVADQVDIPLNVLIRPRIGDFVYHKAEIRAIDAEVDFCKSAGVRGIVIGFLKSDSSVDVSLTRRMVERAFPMSVTFHRAFDLCPDQNGALEMLIEAGVNRVLTSGGQPGAESGIPAISQLVRQAGDRIIILAGGGIHEGNARTIVDQTGVHEIHFSAKRLIHSPVGNSTHVALHTPVIESGSDWYSADKEMIRLIRSRVRI